MHWVLLFVIATSHGPIRGHFEHPTPPACRAHLAVVMASGVAHAAMCVERRDA